MKPKVKEETQYKEDNGVEQTKFNNDAFEAAEDDIEQDPEFKDTPEAGDDIDEGELARFEGE